MDEEEQPEWAVVPEDEYDALNDETFGDTGEVEYSWEDTQKDLFEDLKPTPNEIGHSNGSSNGWNRTAAVAQTPEVTTDARSKETDYYDYENDNALEESISRLVLDDMEDTEDEEEARKMKLSRLGASSNFNTYFMPPQVATKHLHWLMDKELPGGSSLLGSSVWSMHPTATPDDVPTVQQVNVTPNRTMQPTLFNSSTKQPVRTNHISNEIDMLDSENNVSKFFGGVSTSTPINATAAKKPVFKTVEEIERELLEGENTTASPKPTEESINHSKPKVLMAEDLERELIQGSPMPTHPVQNMENIGRSPLQVLPHQNQIFNQQDSPAAAQTQPSQKHVTFAHPSNTNLVTSPNVNFGGMHGAPPMNANAALNNFLMMEQQKQLLMARQGLLHGPGHPIVHPGMAGGPIPPQLAQSFHMQQQHNIRMLQLHPHIRARLPLMMPIPPVIPPHMRPPVLQQMGFPHSHPGFRKQITKTDDVYRGLMTEKDKQRLRNIQIIQLQNDHPFTTDYYNLMHKAKQAAPAGLQLLVKLYPKRDDDSKQKSQYEPARFDNCLGKLQAVSALAPKRVIDTFIRVTECRNAPRAGVKVYRYLLLEIEKLYECLLVMEESDIRMSILCNADEKDLLRRSQNAAKVAKVLMNSEKLLNVLSVFKGKMLVCRSLPLIDPSVRYKVLGRLLDIFPVWGDHDMEKAFPYLRHCILHAEIRDLLTIIGSVTDNQMFESLVVSKLGLTVLMAVFHQAEHLLTRCDQMLLEDIESHWTRKSMFGITAILVKNEHLPNPIEFYPNILHHIRRFAFHGTDVQILEAIFQRWANAGISPRVNP